MKNLTSEPLNATTMEAVLQADNPFTILKDHPSMQERLFMLMAVCDYKCRQPQNDGASQNKISQAEKPKNHVFHKSAHMKEFAILVDYLEEHMADYYWHSMEGSETSRRKFKRALREGLSEKAVNSGILVQLNERQWRERITKYYKDVLEVQRKRLMLMERNGQGDIVKELVRCLLTALIQRDTPEEEEQEDEKEEVVSEEEHEPASKKPSSTVVEPVVAAETNLAPSHDNPETQDVPFVAPPLDLARQATSSYSFSTLFVPQADAMAPPLDNLTRRTTSSNSGSSGDTGVLPLDLTRRTTSISFSALFIPQNVENSLLPSPLGLARRTTSNFSFGSGAFWPPTGSLARRTTSTSTKSASSSNASASSMPPPALEERQGTSNSLSGLFHVQKNTQVKDPPPPPPAAAAPAKSDAWNEEGLSIEDNLAVVAAAKAFGRLPDDELLMETDPSDSSRATNLSSSSKKEAFNVASKSSMLEKTVTPEASIKMGVRRSVTSLLDDDDDEEDNHVKFPAKTLPASLGKTQSIRQHGGMYKGWKQAALEAEDSSSNPSPTNSNCSDGDAETWTMKNDQIPHAVTTRYALVRVKLASGLIRSALQVCLDGLIQTYKQAKNFQADREDHKKEMASAREQLALLWSLYSYVLWEVGGLTDKAATEKADAALKVAPDDDKLEQDAKPSAVSDYEEKDIGDWKMYALMLLSRVRTLCPLTRRHAGVVLAETRLTIRQTLVDGNPTAKTQEACQRAVQVLEETKSDILDESALSFLQSTFSSPPPTLAVDGLKLPRPSVALMATLQDESRRATEEEDLDVLALEESFALLASQSWEDVPVWSADDDSVRHISVLELERRRLKQLAGGNKKKNSKRKSRKGNDTLSASPPPQKAAKRSTIARSPPAVYPRKTPRFRKDA